MVKMSSSEYVIGEELNPTKDFTSQAKESFYIL